MTVLICGSRDWQDYPAVLQLLTKTHTVTPIELIIEGGARGADFYGRTAAIALRVHYKTYPAEWDRYGKSAGYRRNKQMVDAKPDLVMAFQLNGSKGTQHTIDLALAAGIRVILTDENGTRELAPTANPSK